MTVPLRLMLIEKIDMMYRSIEKTIKLPQRRIQNPVKCLRWNPLQKQLTAEGRYSSPQKAPS